MKKLGLTLLAGLISTSAFAAPVGSTFTGFGVGLDLTTTKYKMDDENTKRATGIGIVGDYGFDFGNNLVGLVEGKIKFNNSNIVNDHDGIDDDVNTDEKWRASLSYLQGYRVLPDLLPYVKVSYLVTKIEGDLREDNYFEHSEHTGSGVGIGLGVKYAVSSNFEVGAEYLRSRSKFYDEHVNANTFGANATYRF
ncbi:porin family protein [Otariodibacter sp.]|uniref:porin family protein n=1 Tax=Otariodibacter sp. TaxID=3030919 RepID=UPI002601924B|nr:porin family protein [Otariodibacter sp.]